MVVIKSSKHIKIGDYTVIIPNIALMYEYDYFSRFYLVIDGKSFGFDSKLERDDVYAYIISLL